MSSTYDTLVANYNTFISSCDDSQHNHCQNEGSADWGYVVLN